MPRIVPSELPLDLKSDIKSLNEELANMVSHAFGLLLFASLVPILIFYALRSDDTTSFWGSLVFGVSLIMLYAASTLYHASYKPKIREKLRIFDHICIYFLIAGTYTPMLLTYIKGSLGITFLVIMWTIAVLGAIFKLFYTHRFKVFSTLMYIAMGWMAIFLIEPILTNIPAFNIIWLAVGGALYTLGCIFYLWESLPYNHLVWHIFVLMGSISHFIAIFYSLHS